MKNHKSDSTLLDKDIDIIEEFEISLKDILKACDEKDIDTIKDKVSFLKFLITEFADVLSGELEHLRHRRIIIKKAFRST